MSTCFSILLVLTLATVFSANLATSSEGTSHYILDCKDGKLFRSSCYKLTRHKVIGNSYIRCQQAVITDDAENNFVANMINGALQKDAWIKIEPGNSYSNFAYTSYQGTCLYMDKRGSWYASTWCEAKRLAVCEWQPDCQEGWIGEHCDRQCHCHMERCTRYQEFCKYGCEPGWTGANCFKEVTALSVEHYCVKYRTHYALVLSKNSKSLETGSLVPLDRDGYVITPEQNTDAFNGSDVFEISTTDLSSPFQPNFHERRIDSQGTTFEWSFRFRKFKNARTLGDEDFRVRCNFSEADAMYTSASVEFDVATFGEPSSSSPPPMQTDVEITLTGSTDVGDLDDISIGQPIKVVMNQQSVHVEDGTVEKDAGQMVFLSPRSCVARSADNRVVKQLSDADGCGLEPDLTGWFDIPPKEGEFATQPFAAFGIPGYSSMNISCSLVSCTYYDWNCIQPCTFN